MSDINGLAYIEMMSVNNLQSLSARFIEISTSTDPHKIDCYICHVQLYDKAV